MRKIIVRKGITTDPIVWGLTIHYFYLFLLCIGISVIIAMAIIGFSAMNGSTKGVLTGLAVLGGGLLVSLALKSFLQKKSDTRKYVFGKRVITVANDDILNNL